MNYSAPSSHLPKTLFDSLLILHMSDLIHYILEPLDRDYALGFLEDHLALGTQLKPVEW